MAGYVHCGCRDCMEIAIGEAGALCHHCEDAGCDPERECQAATAYGGEANTGICGCGERLVVMPTGPDEFDSLCPICDRHMIAGELGGCDDGPAEVRAIREQLAELEPESGPLPAPRTPIHAACAANGFCIVSEGTAEPVRVIAAMIRALKTLDTEGRMDAALRGPEAAIPEEALGDEHHAFWSSAEARLVLDALTIALNALAPEGFMFTFEGEATRLGFFR